MENWKTDKLIETLYWIQDRRRYCLTCGKRPPNDYATEAAIYAELTRRGVPRKAAQDKRRS